MKKLVFAACLFAVAAVCAESTPVMLSLLDPVQVPSRDYDVTGFRLSLLYGRCNGFKGLDIGIVGRTDGEFTGLQIGGVNKVDDRFLGGQVGLVNWSSSEVREWDKVSTGAQIGGFNYAGSFCGLQEGLVNFTGDRFTGLQSGLVNVTENLYGVQCGFYLSLQGLAPRQASAPGAQESRLNL